MKTKSITLAVPTFLMLIIALVISLSSCEKTKVKGCMDSAADNYSSTAEESDGSCKYTAELNFYISQSTGSMVRSTGANTARYYVNNEYIGQLATNQTLSAQPYCADKTNVLKKTLSSTSKITSFALRTVDEDGFTWNDQTFTGVNMKSSGYCNTYKW